MSEYERLKAQKEAILQRQWEKLAKRIADVCFGEATQLQIQRIYCVLANIEIPPHHTQNEEPRRASPVEGAASPGFIDGIHTTASAEGAETVSWKCAADRSGGGGNDPQDCDWPTCGCDPHANKVIETLQDCGWHAPQGRGRRRVNVHKDCRPKDPSYGGWGF